MLKIPEAEASGIFDWHLRSQNNGRFIRIRISVGQILAQQQNITDIDIAVTVCIRTGFDLDGSRITVSGLLIYLGQIVVIFFNELGPFFIGVVDLDVTQAAEAHKDILHIRDVAELGT